MSINILTELANINNITPTDRRLRDSIVEEYNEYIDNLDIIDESILEKKIEELPVYKINEGYSIELSSLKQVVQDEHCSVQEAVQKIKDVNYIGNTYPMYCILPEGYNYSMTLESFITLKDILTEAEIIPAVFNKVEPSDFINENYTHDSWIRQARNKAKTKNVKKLHKLIEQTKEKLNKSIEAENNFKKMPKDEREKTVKLAVNIGSIKEPKESEFIKNYKENQKCYKEIIKIYESRLKELESK